MFSFHSTATRKVSPTPVMASLAPTVRLDDLPSFSALRICNNFGLKAGEIANKWEALVIKKGGTLACDDDNLSFLELQV